MPRNPKPRSDPQADAAPPPRRGGRSLDLFARSVFATVAMVLMLLAAGLMAYSVVLVSGILAGAAGAGDLILAGIGYTVISLAVFEVSKYILEEEVIRPSQMRYAGEARRGLTKFISTIAIAVFLEALVLVFTAGKDDMEKMLYPTLLLLAGVALIVGLGIYLKLSVAAEIAVGGVGGEAKAEATADRARAAAEKAEK